MTEDTRPGVEPLFSPARWRAIAAHLKLTPRQSQIARLICEGHTYDGMAHALRISVNTVRLHVRALLRRLDVSDRTGVVIALVRADRALTPRVADHPHEHLPKNACCALCSWRYSRNPPP